MLSGQVNDARITRVVVTLGDGARKEAVVGGGAWYLLLLGQGEPPAIKQIAGFDERGAELHQADMPH